MGLLALLPIWPLSSVPHFRGNYLNSHGSFGMTFRANFRPTSYLDYLADIFAEID
jgi:hypothetical protein